MLAAAFAEGDRMPEEADKKQGLLAIRLFIAACTTWFVWHFAGTNTIWEASSGIVVILALTWMFLIFGQGGDMPEEKVSRYDRDEVKRLEREIELTGDNRFVGLPAADAGPRQPHAIVIHKIPHCVCGHAHDAGNICSRCACRVAKLCNCALAAPPVSQEAAPCPTCGALGRYHKFVFHSRPSSAPDEAMRVARHFHETYERLAPQFGYETRKESAKPWADVPEQNRKLMTAVCAEVLSDAAAQLAEKERELRDIVEELQSLRRKFREHHTLNEAEATRCDVLIDLLTERLQEPK